MLSTILVFFIETCQVFFSLFFKIFPISLNVLGIRRSRPPNKAKRSFAGGLECG